MVMRIKPIVQCFPILYMNRQILADLDRSLREKCSRNAVLDFDRSPVVNLFVRVKEKHSVWELMIWAQVSP